MLSLRHQALIGLVPAADGLVVDVGADHGYVAAALGAVAVERMPRRIAGGRAGNRWVIADGLRPFRRVSVAVIAGMGADRIVGIAHAGPIPEVVVAHADDDPGRLRTAMKPLGWRVDAEVAAPEGRRWAEVVRFVRGDEPARPARLWMGPRLLEQDDPRLRDFWAWRAMRLRGVLSPRRGSGPDPETRAWIESLLACIPSL